MSTNYHQYCIMGVKIELEAIEHDGDYEILGFKVEKPWRLKSNDAFLAFINEHGLVAEVDQDKNGEPAALYIGYALGETIHLGKWQLVEGSFCISQFGRHYDRIIDLLEDRDFQLDIVAFELGLHLFMSVN